MDQDTVANLYDFPAREYGTQGRWPSPDPAGLAAVDPTNPESWNRYAYVLNNPLSRIDPTGMNDCEEHADCGDSWLIGLQPGQDIWGTYWGANNPAKGCGVGDITNCAAQQDNRNMHNDMAALNKFGITVAETMYAAWNDYNQAVLDDLKRALSALFQDPNNPCAEDLFGNAARAQTLLNNMYTASVPGPWVFTNPTQAEFYGLVANGVTPAATVWDTPCPSCVGRSSSKPGKSWHRHCRKNRSMNSTAQCSN